jgi:ADP-heptose:LPS heptosyltransferase
MKILIFPWAKTMRNGKKHPKNYPYWPELINMLTADGHTIIQVGGGGEEQLVPDFRPGLPYGELIRLVHECDTWIGVDSFGQHLGWSVGRRGIAIFGQSDPNIFGHPENVNLLKDRANLRERQFWLWEQCEANDSVWVTPEEVVTALRDNFINVSGNWV